MTETEEVARAIYEGRNGRGCTPWQRLPKAHQGPYLADAMAAIRVILERQYPALSQTKKGRRSRRNDGPSFREDTPKEGSTPETADPDRR